MPTYTFDHFINLLPKCDAFPTDRSLPQGVSYGQLIPQFTPPNIAVAEGELADSQVVIIAAPGSVGKSTLAKALSSKRGALIWDLAVAEEVGYGSLDAILEHTMQPGLKADFLEWMSEGIQFIIIDALDEGRIKVNENSFSRLLENISRLAKNAKGICFVLLGRSQIAESVWLGLTDQHIEASILTIEPFTREQANEYLQKHAERELTKPFIECRDLIFKRLEAPIKDGPDNDTADEFLHYPPVLDVISVLLNSEGNLMALKNFLDGRTPETSAKLLQDVIDHILQREQQQKIVPAFLQSLTTEGRRSVFQLKDDLYTAFEQSQRLLSSVLDVVVDCTPEVLPVKVEAAYNAAVEQALTEHPFLRGANRFANSVFESYLYARALRGDFGSELADRVTDVLTDLTSLPRTLLAEFYLGTEMEGESVPQRVKPEHVGLLYDSLLSSESSRRRVRLSIESSDPAQTNDSEIGHGDGEFELFAIDREDEVEYEPQLIPFSLVMGQNAVISFRTYIKDVHVTAPCTIGLGLNVAEFKIGPSVYLDVSRLLIGSESIVIERVPPKYNDYIATGVTLEALSFEAPRLIGSPIVYAEDFSISWPGDEVFPWRAYRRDKISSEFDDEILHKAYLRFRRIATAFQSRGKGNLARSRVKIENTHIMQGKLEEYLIGELVDDGVLYFGDGGRRYYWNPGRAHEQLGVSWIDLRKGECPEKLSSYLSAFIARHPALQ